MAMKLAGNRKGMYFTLIAVLIVAVLFVSFSPSSEITLKSETQASRARITTADDFVKTVKEAYLPSALRTSSYSALNALSIYLKEREEDSPGSGLFASNAELQQNFAEVMLNGSIFCEIGGVNAHVPVDECLGQDLMGNRNLTRRLRDIEESSWEALRIRTNFTRIWYDEYGVTLYQNNDTGPFQVGVNVTVNFSVNAGLAWWNDTETIPVIFSFEGMEDPLYSTKSENAIGTRHTNVFNRTNFTHWNLTQVFMDIEWRRYRHERNGSSFLTRFTENDVRSECCGIESLINPYQMEGLPPGRTENLEAPYADWCVFGSRCPPNQPGALWNITCISSVSSGEKFRGFALDTYHLTALNLSNPDAEGRTLFYGATDPNSAAECQSMMQAVCNVPDSPWACTG